MSLKPYSDYKDSGVEWLGEVPRHWDIWKVSHAFRSIGSGTTPPSDESEWYDGGEICWITTGELRESVIFDTEKKVTTEALQRYTALRVHPAGSLAVAMYGATTGRLGILGVPATTNQACCVVSDPVSLRIRFLFHWLVAFRKQIVEQFSTGGGQPNINQDIIRALRVPAPSLADQAMIVTFLDRETAKIDALVAEQERLITLLKEKRQAVISHAVTKGLDPNVRMKDSGVEWIGEVPEHWEVGSLKRHWQVTDCKHVTAEFVEEGFPLASIREVQSRYLNLDQSKKTTSEYYGILIEGGRKPQSGDLVFSRNATVGEVSQVADWHPPFAMGQDVCLLRKSDPGQNSDFLQLILKSDFVMTQVDLLMVGSTFKRINVDDIRNIIVLFPPADEQRSIANFILENVTSLDGLIAEGHCAIGLLTERRSALISAAVTGKVDVRGLVLADAA